jgi:hypothetical protein
MSIDKKPDHRQERQAVNCWMDFSAYVSKPRFNSYWHQINEVLASIPESILEIGVGANFVGQFLSARNFRVVTYDLEHELRPTIIGSVTHLPFRENSFDTVMCCQVLEHLPFECFKPCLLEIRSVCRKVLVLSLPDRTPALSGVVRVPNLIFWDFVISLHLSIREPLRSSRKHFWEIGRLGFSLRWVRREIEGASFLVRRTYRVPEFPYHRFFVAEPN